MRGSGRRLQLLAIVLAALATSWLSLPRVELCVGSDGHVALEPLGASCCAEARHETVLGMGGHCAPGCVDTPLELSLASSAGHRQPAPPLALAVLHRQPQLDGSPCSSPGGGGASRPLAPPRVLHTTVFLC